MNYTDQEKQVVLGLPIDMKLDLLETALSKGEFGVFMKFAQILLDAPLSEGGVQTEVIEDIRRKFF